MSVTAIIAVCRVVSEHIFDSSRSHRTRTFSATAATATTPPHERCTLCGISCSLPNQLPHLVRDCLLSIAPVTVFATIVHLSSLRHVRS